MDTKQKIDQINDQITELQEQRKLLEEEFFKDPNIDFITKFQVWYENDEECHELWIPSYPLIRKEIDNNDFQRHETISIQRLIGEDDMWILFEGKEIDEISDEQYNEVLRKWQPLLEEAMDKQIKSFDLDW